MVTIIVYFHPHPIPKLSLIISLLRKQMIQKYTFRTHFSARRVLGPANEDTTLNYTDNCSHSASFEKFARGFISHMRED